MLLKEKNIKSFKGLGYAHSLSFLRCFAKWLICTKCMERQTNSYRMKAHRERCSGITINSIESADIYVYTSSWLKQKHDELKSTSSPDAQSFLSMIENESGGNV